MLAFLQSLAYIATVEALPGARGFRVYPKQGKQITAELSQSIRDNNWDISSLHAENGRLDEVFRTITMGSNK